MSRIFDQLLFGSKPDDKNIDENLGQTVDMRLEKGRETMALTGLRTFQWPFSKVNFFTQT